MWCDSDGVADGCDNDFKGGNARNLISVMAVLNSINCVDSAQRHPFATIIPCNLLKFNNVPAINKPIASSKFHYVYFTRVLLAEFVFIIPSLSELPEIEFIFTACNITENSDPTTPTLQTELTGRIFPKIILSQNSASIFDTSTHIIKLRISELVEVIHTRILKHIHMEIDMIWGSFQYSEFLQFHSPIVQKAASPLGVSVFSKILPNELPIWVILNLTVNNRFSERTTSNF